jgi:hypothetical protein
MSLVAPGYYARDAKNVRLLMALREFLVGNKDNAHLCL